MSLSFCCRNMRQSPLGVTSGPTTTESGRGVPRTACPSPRRAAPREGCPLPQRGRGLWHWFRSFWTRNASFRESCLFCPHRRRPKQRPSRRRSAGVPQSRNGPPFCSACACLRGQGPSPSALAKRLLCLSPPRFLPRHQSWPAGSHAGLSGPAAPACTCVLSTVPHTFPEQPL